MKHVKLLSGLTGEVLAVSTECLFKDFMEKREKLQYSDNFYKCKFTFFKKTVRLQEIELLNNFCVLPCFSQLYEAYSNVCRKQQVAAVDQSECLSLSGLLEARGILGLKKNKETRFTKVQLTASL